MTSCDELQALLGGDPVEGGGEWKAAQHARCEVRAMRERAGLSGERLTASGVSDEEAVDLGEFAPTFMV